MLDEMRGALPMGAAPLFQAPWQTRIFALIVALVQAGHFPWTAFQTRLAANITEAERGADPCDAAAIEARYFDCWLRAVEEVLAAEGLIDGETVAAQIEVLRTSVEATRAAQTDG